MNTGRSLTRRIDYFILFLALFNVIYRLAFSGNLEYHRDELLYFSLGLHPAFGYDTVPPIVGWIAWLAEHIFGYSVFAVRFIPSVLSGGMIFLVSGLAGELGGSRYASRLAAVGLTVSIFFMRSFFLFQPVFLEIFFWTLCIYILLKYINTENERFLLWFGLAAGFALLNKYLAGLLFAGMAIIIPFTEYRKVFIKRRFWQGLIIGFLVFSPNLVWQISRGFPAFTHISRLYDTQLVYMNAPLFLTEQLIMPFAGSVLTIAGMIFLIAGKESVKFRFLGYLSLFVILSLMVMKGKSYYTLGVFPMLIAAGAVSFETWIRGKHARILLPFIMVFLTIPLVPMGVPALRPDGLKSYFRILEEKTGIELGRRFEDGTIHSLPQDYADMLGWEELTAVTNKAYNMVDDKSTCIIYGENYGEAGAVTIIGKKYGLPGAISFHESFRFWFPKEFDPDITSLIYINDEMGDDVKGLFKKITVIGGITDPDAREYGTLVYLCEDPASSFNDFWKARTEEF